MSTEPAALLCTACREAPRAPGIARCRECVKEARETVRLQRELAREKEQARRARFVDWPDGRPIPGNRPRTRADCYGIPRPCPWVGCRHNNFLEVTRAGTLQTCYEEPDEMPAELSCSLDVAESGEATLVDVGRVFGLTRERIRQIEVRALARIAERIRTARDDG